MLMSQSTEFNRGFPESLGLAFPSPLPELNLFSMEAFERHFWLLAGVLMLFVLAAAFFWVKRKKPRIATAEPIAKPQLKYSPYKNEMSLMLTLAKQYHAAGYSQNALQLLNTVLAHGTEAEGDEAFQLITQIQKAASPNAHHVF